MFVKHKRSVLTWRIQRLLYKGHKGNKGHTSSPSSISGSLPMRTSRNTIVRKRSAVSRPWSAYEMKIWRFLGRPLSHGLQDGKALAPKKIEGSREQEQRSYYGEAYGKADGDPCSPNAVSCGKACRQAIAPPLVTFHLLSPSRDGYSLDAGEGAEGNAHRILCRRNHSARRMPMR